MMGEKNVHKCKECGSLQCEVMVDTHNVFKSGDYLFYNQGNVVLTCLECATEEKIYIGAGVSW